MLFRKIFSELFTSCRNENFSLKKSYGYFLFIYLSFPSLNSRFLMKRQEHIKNHLRLIDFKSL